MATQQQERRRKWRRGTLAALALLLLAGGVLWGWKCWSAVPMTREPLREDAYVWQYRWNTAVQAAVDAADAEENLTELLVVAAEIMPGGGAPRRRPVRPDYAQLARSKKAVGLVIRVGSHGGPFAEENPMSVAVRSAAEEVLRQAAAAGLRVAELQLDFDCPTRCLADYAEWVWQVKAVAGEIPVTLTALPSWLGAAGFRPLLAATDGYVLQVHSVVPPQSPEEIAPLCDPEKTRRWVVQAARLGKPFRVALPTYAYRVGFDARGKYQGVAAEMVPEHLRGAKQWRLLTAEAEEMAALVREWRRERPASLNGVVWYRLSVEGDRFNWSWGAWKMVRAGKVPKMERRGSFAATQPLLFDGQIENTGELAVLLPEEIIWEWQGAAVVALDAVGGYRVMERGENRACLRREGNLEILLPGEKRPVGWIRFKAPPESLRMVSPDF